MSGTGQKVCGGGGGWVVVETNYSVKLKLKLNNNIPLDYVRRHIPESVLKIILTIYSV